MQLACTLITKEVETLAKRINKSAAYTNLLVSAWQTKNQRDDMPSADELTAFMRNDKQTALDAYFSVPMYKVDSEFFSKHDGLSGFHISNGEIIIAPISDLQAFYSRYSSNPELYNKLINTVKSINQAYRFVLWQAQAVAMGFKMSDSSSYALNKLIEWNKRQGNVTQTTSQRQEVQQAQETQQVVARNDGKVQLTKEQENAVQTVVSFVKDRMAGRGNAAQPFITIKGMAGTGKTTIVSTIIKQLQKDHMMPNTAVAALSRKAVGVLSNKLKAEDIDVDTESLYTLAGAAYGQSDNKFAIDPTKAALPKYSLIFVDEASMVGNHMYQVFLDYIKENPKTCIVFLGDYGQARPIADKNEMSHKSPIFGENNTTTKIVELTQRIRQGEDSPILSYADKFYEVSVGKSANAVLQFKNSQTVVTQSGAIVFDQRNTTDTSEKVLALFEQGFKKKSNSLVKIVAGTNATVNRWNTIIHNRFFPNSLNEMCAGDHIIFNAPYPISKYETIDNATEGTIEKVSRVYTDSTGIQYNTITIKTQDGKVRTINRAVQTQENLTLIKSISDKLKKRAIEADPLSRANAWRAFYSFQDQYADISWGYAITTHKSQGSTYDTVVVDIMDIMGVNAWSNQEQAELIYTALTRSRNMSIVLTDRGSSTKVNSYVEINDSIEQHKNTPQPVNSVRTQQQLPSNNPVNSQQETERRTNGGQTSGNTRLHGLLSQTPTQVPSSSSQQVVEDPNSMPDIGTTEHLKLEENPVSKVSRTFTPQKRRDRINLIGKHFSDVIDEVLQQEIEACRQTAVKAYFTLDKAQKENNYLKVLEAQQALQANINREKLLQSPNGRKAAIDIITVRGLFERVRQVFEEYLENAQDEGDEYAIQEYQKVLDNWEVLLREALPILESRESLRIIPRKVKDAQGNEYLAGDLALTTQQEEEDEDAHDDDELGNRVSGNDGWAFQARFIDPHKTLSKDVKAVLSNIVRYTPQGQIDTDDLGNMRYIPEEYAHAVLISQLSDMINPEDFAYQDEEGWHFPALERLLETPQYSWVREIINTLSADPNLIAKFYSDFRKDFIPYWLQDEKGKTVALNTSTVVDSNIGQLTRNVENGYLLDPDSIYNTSGEIVKDNALLAQNLVAEVSKQVAQFNALDESEYQDVVNKIKKIINMTGIDVPVGHITALLLTEDGRKALRIALNDISTIGSEVTKENSTITSDSNYVTTFKSYLSNICKEVGVIGENDHVQSFRLGEKTIPSYAAPNYLDTMIKNLTSDNFAEYMEREFGYDTWFKKDGVWRNQMLKLIADSGNRADRSFVRKNIELKDLKGYRTATGEYLDYADWTDDILDRIFINEYFSTGNNQFAWYHFPIFSDSTVAKFIKFVKYTDTATQTFEERLKPLFREVVWQELDRIKLVQDRKKVGISQIAAFDKNGEKFHFFPELNNDQDFWSRLEELKKKNNIKGINDLIDEKVSQIVEAQYKQFLATTGATAIIQELQGQGAVDNNLNPERAAKEYFYNSFYMTSQIIQLTTTDLAYYKDLVDFQKRYKEVYASGSKLFTGSKYGRTTERTVYLKDIEIRSLIYQDIKAVLDRAVKEGRIQSYDRENILKMFKAVNVTDAQAFRSLESMRSVLDMMGLWTDEMAESMERLGKGQWDMSDFNTVWQTIKPFVYTTISKPNGVGGQMRVPHQNKNSEFLLLAMYSQIASSLGRASMVRAINRWMTDNNIDVIQFESAVKVGKQGVIDLSYSEERLEQWLDQDDNREDIEDVVYVALKENNKLSEEDIQKKITKMSSLEKFILANDYLLDTDSITQEEYNERHDAIAPTETDVYNTLNKYTKFEESDEADIQNGVYGTREDGTTYQIGDFKPTVVHEIPYSAYVVQTPTPEHLLDTLAVFGSQFRNLILSDLPDSPDFRIKVGDKEYTKSQIITLFKNIITENLIEDYNRAAEKFGDIHTLQKELLKTVEGNNNYGRDIVEALQIVTVTNPYTGKQEEVFNIPLSNPSTTLKLQQLLNSKFKNAVTKQQIKGGACILVSDVGFTKELNVIIDKETGAVKGVECYMPAYSREFFEEFLTYDADGNGYLDINKMPQELREAIGYRIPTEDKYSMAPLIIKGFLPQQNGSAIMLPADITRIAGSDFDVDKLFLMLHEFKREYVYDFNAAWKGFYEAHPDIAQSKDKSQEVKDAFKNWFKKHRRDYIKSSKIVKVQYDQNKSVSENSRAARNNMLIDISRAILTHPATADKFLNPGNFDSVKVGARASTIIKDKDLLKQYAQDVLLLDISESGLTKDVIDKISKDILDKMRQGRLDDLDDFLSKHKKTMNPLSHGTFVYFHQQNMVGAKLIGIYANITSMQAKHQGVPLAIKDAFKFTIDGFTVGSLTRVTDMNGSRISKNCANFSAASVDNVKDPVLASLMQNTDTAEITGTMIRLGLSIDVVSLIFSDPNIVALIKTKNLTSYQVEKALKSDKYSNIPLGPNDLKITSEEIASNIIASTIDSSQEDVITSAKVLKIMQKVLEIQDALSEITRVSRADSPNGAIKTTMGGALRQVIALRNIHEKSKTTNYPLVGIEHLINVGTVNSNTNTDTMRRVFSEMNFSSLQAFFSLGIECPTQVIEQYLPQISPAILKAIDTLCEENPRGIISENLINAFLKDEVTFALQSTRLFGNDGKSTFKQKRDAYLNNFPDLFIKAKENNPEFAKLGVLQKMSVKNGILVFDRAGRLSADARESFMRDMDNLLTMGAEGQKLALDLLLYSFYLNGLNFGHSSYGQFFSSHFLSQIPEYVNTLRYLDYIMDEAFTKRFYNQFIYNYWNQGLFKVKSSMFFKTTMSFKYTEVFNEITHKPFEYIVVEESLTGEKHLMQLSNVGRQVSYTEINAGKTRYPYYNSELTSYNDFVTQAEQIASQEAQSEFDELEEMFGVSALKSQSTQGKKEQQTTQFNQLEQSSITDKLNQLDMGLSVERESQFDDIDQALEQSQSLDPAQSQIDELEAKLMGINLDEIEQALEQTPYSTEEGEDNIEEHFCKK